MTFSPTPKLQRNSNNGGNKKFLRRHWRICRPCFKHHGNGVGILHSPFYGILELPATRSFLRRNLFWISQRPDAFNGISAFVLGIFADVVSAAPLGVNVMAFLVLYFLASRFSASFNIKKFSYSWMLFAVAAFAAMLFKALIISAFYRAFVPLNFLVFEYLLTVTLYPILARFYIWAEGRYIHLEERYEKI